MNAEFTLIVLTLIRLALPALLLLVIGTWATRDRKGGKGRG